MSRNGSGGVKDRVLDFTGQYLMLMVVVVLLFGGATALALNHALMHAIGVALGGIVRELPGMAATVQQIRGDKA